MNNRAVMTRAQRNPSTGGDAISSSSETMQTQITSSMSMAGGDQHLTHNLSLQLTVHKLNGNNYLEWAQFVKLAIDGRGKLGSLTGEIKESEARDPNLKAWRSENSLVITWLINSTEPGIGKPHLFLLTAKDVWEAVHEMYSDVENSSQIFELKEKLEGGVICMPFVPLHNR